MNEMCNGGVGSSYGLTECAGTVIFSPFDSTVEGMVSSLGFDTDFCRISIREPMVVIENDEGGGEEMMIAGKILPDGEVGEICFQGPQVFKGYYGMEEETKKTLSSDGILYTGDIGSYDPEKGGLKFSSRRKFVIKPKGFQVYPPDVEDHISNRLKGKVQFVAIVGVKHEVYSQGVVAVIKRIEKEKEEEGEEEEEEEEEEKILDVEEVMEVCKDLPSYKRPSLIIFEDEFPLNRNLKTDYLEVTRIAEEEVEKLRKEGGWDQ